MRHPLMVLAGALMPLAWAPTTAWPLALIGFGLLFAQVRRSRSPADAFFLGALFGLAMHTSGHLWIYATLHERSGVAALPATLASATFFGFFALFIAVPCTVWRLLGGATPGYRAAWAWAALMTLGEWARSLPFNGFTSLSLGIAAVDTPAASLLPFAGVYRSLLGYGAAASSVVALGSGSGHWGRGMAWAATMAGLGVVGAAASTPE